MNDEEPTLATGTQQDTNQRIASTNQGEGVVTTGPQAQMANQEDDGQDEKYDDDQYEQDDQDDGANDATNDGEQQDEDQV